MTPDRHLASARAFAQALDEEDYEAAARLLADTCTYRIREETHTGPSAIIATYQAAGDWVRANLDECAYESEVRIDEQAGVALVRFVDRIRHAGHELVHTCEQALEFDDRGRIVRIDHRDLPGEQAKLAAFNEAAGLDR